MQVPPTVTFRGVRRSAAMVDAVTRRIAGLERYHRRITACRVLVEFGEARHESGNRYHVRIDLSVPGGEIVVGAQPSLRRAVLAAGRDRTTKSDETGGNEKYLKTALQRTFAVAERRLQDFTRRQRGDVKVHADVRVKRR